MIRRAPVAWLAAMSLAATLLLGAGSTAASGDAPDRCARVGSATYMDAWIQGKIGSATDVDWYRFAVPLGASMQIVLGALPADYQMDVYYFCGGTPYRSYRPGTEFEELIARRDDHTGDVYVRVSTASGASSSDPYKLRLRVLPRGLTILSRDSFLDDGGARHIVGEVLAIRWSYRNVQVVATLHDGMGGVIGSASKRIMLRVLRQRYQTRSPFEIVFDPPPGFDHFSLSVAGNRAFDPPAPGLKFVEQGSYVDDLGVRHFRGHVYNRDPYAWEPTIDSLQVFVTVYDSLVRVINVGVADTNKVSLAPDERASFDAAFADHYAQWNRWRATGQALPVASP